jgi:hypothetical protein
MFDLRFTYSLLRLQMRIFSSGLVYAKRRLYYAQALLAVLNVSFALLIEVFIQQLQPDVYTLLAVINNLLHVYNIGKIECELDLELRVGCNWVAYKCWLCFRTLEQYCNFQWSVKKMRNSTTGLMYQRI